MNSNVSRAACRLSTFITVFLMMALLTSPLPGECTVWDLSPLFADDSAWEEAFAPMRGDIRALGRHRETVAGNPSGLLDYLREAEGVRARLNRLYTYASLYLSTDTRNADFVEREQRVRLLYSALAEATSWFRPLMMELGAGFVEEALAAEEGLAPYAHPLRNLMRYQERTFSAEVEEVLSRLNPVWRGTTSARSTFFNADFPWPEVTLSTGETVVLNTANYQRLRQTPVREDRRLVVETYFEALRQFERTFGELYYQNVLNQVVGSRLRKHDTALAQALFSDNLPDEVYHTLIEEVHAGLPALHRYMDVRRRLLGLDELAYYDVSHPLVVTGETFDFERAVDLTRRSAVPLGEDYMRRLEAGLDGRYMHVYPAEGKRSGAFMSGGIHDAHPYVFLNHLDNFNSVSTMAHEWGHAIHSVLSNETQPPATARYSLFIAEIAAFTNQYLLYHYMQANARTPEERLFHLLEEVDHKRGAYYRQTQFAEFEYATHSAVQRDEPLSGRRLSGIYQDILRRYFGHEEGVVRIDDVYAAEWSFVPHFFSNFYVYNYATSTAAAAWFTERILAGDEAVLERYLELLRAGGRDYPYNLLLEAGLDMASPEPYRAVPRRIDAILEEIENLIVENPGLAARIAISGGAEG